MLTTPPSSSPSFLSDDFRAKLTHSLRAAGFLLHDAEDAVQDAVLKAIARNKPEPIEQPEAWLFTVARNSARKSSTRRRERPAEPLMEPATSPLEEFDDAEEKERLSRAMLSAIEELPPLKREAIRLHHLDGLTIRGVADSLGIGQGSVRRHLQDAREMIRQHLLENCEIARRRYEMTL